MFPQICVCMSYRVCVDPAGHFPWQEILKASGSWNTGNCCRCLHKVRVLILNTNTPSHTRTSTWQFDLAGLIYYFLWQSWLTVMGWTMPAEVDYHQALMKPLRALVRKTQAEELVFTIIVERKTSSVFDLLCRWSGSRERLYLQWAQAKV